MFREKNISSPLSYLFLIFMSVALLFSGFSPDAKAERKTRVSAKTPLNLKVVPAKTKIKAGKIKRFRVKSSSDGALYRAEEKGRKIVWYVNGIKGGNKEVGRINKNGKFRAPKYVASKTKAVIGFKLTPESN